MSFINKCRQLRCNGKKPSCSRCSGRSINCQYETSPEEADSSGKPARAFKHSTRAVTPKFTTVKHTTDAVANPTNNETQSIATIDDRNFVEAQNSPLSAMHDWLVEDVDAESVRSLSDSMILDTRIDTMQPPNSPGVHQGHSSIYNQPIGK